MNRAQRRAFAATQRGPAPAYGRPADLFRQLAALDVTATIVRGHRTVRLDYRAHRDRERELRAALAAFPSGEAWDVDCLAVLTIITGDMLDQIPRGSSASVSLARVLADPVNGALTRSLLENGARH